MSSAYLRLLIFLPAILIPACASSSPAFLMMYFAAAAKSLRLHPTLCNPIDGSSPGSPIPGILQARILEWVAISFSNAWKWKVKVKSCLILATPWTTAYQAPLSMGFSRQDYWSGVPLPSLMYSACKLNKQGDNMQPWSTPFPICHLLHIYYTSNLSVKLATLAASYVQVIINCHHIYCCYHHLIWVSTQTYFWEIAGSILDLQNQYCNKSNHNFLWFPRAYKSYFTLSIIYSMQ